MHRARYMWITLTPLLWLVSVTFTAGFEKIFADDPRLGFLSHAAALENATRKVAETRAVIFNERLDAVVCGVFLALVAVIVLDSARVWFGLLRGTRAAVSSESPFIPSNLEAEGV
jgi:carbon starvation protein